MRVLKCGETDMSRVTQLSSVQPLVKPRLPDLTLLQCPAFKEGRLTPIALDPVLQLTSPRAPSVIHTCPINTHSLPKQGVEKVKSSLSSSGITSWHPLVLPPGSHLSHQHHCPPRVILDRHLLLFLTPPQVITSSSIYCLFCLFLSYIYCSPSPALTLCMLKWLSCHN